ICNQKFTYAQFAGWFEYSDAGFSIYRFGDPTPSGIPIDAEHFPDEAFRNCVHEAFDANGDWYLSDSEISNAKTMQFGGKGISDATGIKLLTSLEWVELQDNSIRVLDLSGMTKLTSLWCWNNGMTGLSVSGCSSLPELWAYDNALRVLNVSKCASLKKIYIWTNNFTGLSLSNLPSLEGVWAAGCKSMKELYVENNPAMTMLYVDKCTALEEIHAKGSSKINSLLLDDCNSLKKFERDSSVNLSAYVPKITTTSLPRGYVGENYSATVKASGIGVITYSGTATFVANGFYFYGGSLYTENTTGRIRGVPVTAATRSYTITASNFAGSTSKNYSITVINNGKGPKITTAFLSNGVKGRYYSVPIAETGGIAPITWARVSGTLPPGTKLGTSGRTVYLSGTPTATGTYTFRVQAADSTSTPVLRLPLYDMKEFTVRIRNPLAFSDGIRDGLQGSSGQGFGSGVVKQAYTGKITVSGGASPYTLSSSGTLPNGSKLSLSGSTVTLSGLPTKAGKYTFTVKIKDSDGNLLEKTYTVNVTQTTISGTIPSTVVR
ncbi:MAG: putative Ig domain-containing protein, partial [Synergistaceae bacterium]|nr:putative Ig domain-containing protein [Synergistaceae bacterium]